MFITAGTFGYAFIVNLLNSFIGISYYLLFLGSAASDSDELPTCSTLATLGGALLAVTLTFPVLLDSCDVRDASPFARPTLAL